MNLRNKYTVNFSFISTIHFECPFNERISSLDPAGSIKHFTSNDLSYCRIFGYKHKCDCMALNEADYPEWCPIVSAERIADE